MSYTILMQLNFKNKKFQNFKVNNNNNNNNNNKNGMLN